MSSRSRARVATGRSNASQAQSGRARAPPSAHLTPAAAAARSILQSSRSRSSSRGGGGQKKPVGRMPAVDLSDLQNEFNLRPRPPRVLGKPSSAPPTAPARNLAELKLKRKLGQRPYVHHAIDIDGDGVVDDVEMALSKLMDTMQGEDLDGDGEVTQEELTQTKIKKGKEILARQFVEKHQKNIRNFWPDFDGLSDGDIVKAITSNVDYRMLMSNLTNKAMVQELLYDSVRIKDSLRFMATDREKRWQMKKQQMKQSREKLFSARFKAVVAYQREGQREEREHERQHLARKQRTFTPMLDTRFKSAPDFFGN